MVTSIKDWKKQAQVGKHEIDLPSGNTCLAQRLQPEAFLASGTIPDSLSPIVTEAIRTKKGLPPNALDDMTKDPKRIAEAMRMIDQVTCYIVIEPPVYMPPTCEVCEKYYNDNPAHTDLSHKERHTYNEADRDEETLYADEVDLNDRMFLFQWAVGGTADVESFRAQLEAGVGGLSAGKAVPRKAKRSARSK